MKLIDPRAAAIEIAATMAYEANMEYDGAGYHYTKNDYIDVAELWFKNVPTIEAEPVRRGRWEYREIPVFGNPYGSYECSECGNAEPHKTCYCSYCGALMEGE